MYAVQVRLRLTLLRRENSLIEMHLMLVQLQNVNIRQNVKYLMTAAVAAKLTAA